MRASWRSSNSSFEDDEYIFGARAGGYLLKDTPSEEHAAAIVKAQRGETVLCGTGAARVVKGSCAGRPGRRSRGSPLRPLAFEGPGRCWPGRERPDEVGGGSCIEVSDPQGEPA